MNFELPDLSAAVAPLLAALPTALIVTLGAIVLHHVACRSIRVLARRTSITEEQMFPVYRLVKWAITVVALVLILSAFNMNLAGVWGVLSTILAMIAIGFVAVWSVLSNALCTIIIMIFRPFSIGDEIEFAGEPIKGRVVDLNFIYTTLDTGEGSVMQVPNNLFVQKAIRRRHAARPTSVAAHLRTKRPEQPAETLAAPAAATPAAGASAVPTATTSQPRGTSGEAR